MRRALALLISGYTLLGAAWLMVDGPFAAPDESAHYARALGIAQGALIGPRGQFECGPALPQLSCRWAAGESRVQRLPAVLSPLAQLCAVGRAEATPACARPSPAPAGSIMLSSTAGTFQPLPYLLPAVVMPAAHAPASADRLGRAASLLPCLLLLALALVVLAGEGPTGWLGILLAVTPQALFLAASLTGSGLEAFAGLAFAALLLSLSRPDAAGVDRRRLRARWLLAGLCGALLALSRTLGPVWLVLDVAVIGLVFGARRLAATARRAPGAAALAVMAWLAGIAVNRVWEGAYGERPPTDLIPSIRALHNLRPVLGDLWWGAIGRFGSLEVRPPPVLLAVWALGAIALVVGGALLAGRRVRAASLASAGLIAVGAMWFAALVLEHTAFSLQGRDVLAALMVPVLIGGELVHRHRAGLPAMLGRLLLPATALAVGALQLACLAFDARRFAVGAKGKLLFFLDPVWSPPGGWWPWLVAGTLGAVAVAGAGMLGPRRGPALGSATAVNASG